MGTQESHEADVIIVGAGIAGALIAYKLSKRGFKVIVFEAGQRFTRAEILEKQRSIWQENDSAHFPDTELAPRFSTSTIRKDYIKSVGPVDYTANYLRGVGGTTWHWHAVCHRLLPADMLLRTNYGVGLDWPYDYDELESFYGEAEVELGVAGDSSEDLGSPRTSPFPQKAVAESYAEKRIKQMLEPHGFRFHPKPTARNSGIYDGRAACEGHHNCSRMCPIGAQYAAIVHVEKSEVLGAKYIAEALVTQIIVDQNNSISGIKFRQPDNVERDAKARLYVLAANPIETPRLCLASTSETLPNGIANSSGMVGKRLMDHPTFDLRFNIPEPVYAGRGPYSSIGNSSLRDGKFRKDKASAVLSFENIDVLSEVATNAMKLYPHDPIKLMRLIRYQTIRRLVLSGVTEQLPDDSNRVFVDHSSRDATTMPQIKIHYSLDEYTKRGIAAAKNRAKNIAQKLGADDTILNDGYFGPHASGTMMMGANSQKYVTDSDGRTHDHSNLFVAGSSLFPAVSAVNPTLTLAAVALRTERKIFAQLKGASIDD